MFPSGLLLLTSPVTQLLSRLGSILKTATSHVDKTLYIHIAPELTSDSGIRHLSLNADVKRFVHGVYYQAAAIAHKKDVRFLLGNISSGPVSEFPNYSPCRGYEVVLAEVHSSVDKDTFMKYASRCMPVENAVEFKLLETEAANDGEMLENGSEAQLCDESSCKSYDHVVLGGTFDRLHAGHQILLSEALLSSNKSLTVGVTEANMNTKKTLCEMIEPTADRIEGVKRFLNDVKPGLVYKVVPIVDPFGPSIVDPDLQCIVVSRETVKGAEAVNKKRREKGLSTLCIDIIELLEDKHHAPEEESKLSSSSTRMRLLGTILKPPLPRGRGSPYIIGLTGGIASGKSSICKRLAKLGAAIVDCDKLGHVAYKKGTPTFNKVVEAFGNGIVNEDGEINRRALGGIVFADPEHLKKLNQIVWPAIAELAKGRINDHASSGASVVVLDAAVLLEAGWQEIVNEVWISLIPKEEAIKRIMERNKIPEGEAIKRIEAQSSNAEKVSHANVVLSTLWDPAVTQLQVEKAWHLLNDRINAAPEQH